MNADNHQYPWQKELSTISQMTPEQREQQLTREKRTKKCHGNRRLQRLRKKCRANEIND